MNYMNKTILLFIIMMHLPKISFAFECGQFLQIKSFQIESNNNLDYLFNSTPPSYEDLIKSFDAKKPKVIPKFMNNQNFNIDFFRQVLNIFNVTSNADYYFIGNGFYIPYLMAKAMFSGTDLESRIKFISFSRPLASQALEDIRPFVKYYKSLGFSESKKIVIIDTLSDHLEIETNENSIMKLYLSLVNYLKIEKNLSQQEAMDTIIVIGYPELSIPKASFEVNSLASYDLKIKEIENSDILNTQLPYLKIGSTDPFIEFYSRDGSDISWQGTRQDFYWNGKFNRLGKDGMPKGKVDLSEYLRSGNLDALNSEINLRKSRIAIYEYVIAEGLKFKFGQLKQEITEILAENFEL